MADPVDRNIKHSIVMIICKYSIGRMVTRPVQRRNIPPIMMSIAAKQRDGAVLMCFRDWKPEKKSYYEMFWRYVE